MRIKSHKKSNEIREDFQEQIILSYLDKKIITALYIVWELIKGSPEEVNEITLKIKKEKKITKLEGGYSTKDLLIDSLFLQDSFPRTTLSRVRRTSPEEFIKQPTIEAWERVLFLHAIGHTFGERSGRRVRVESDSEKFDQLMEKYEKWQAEEDKK